MSTFDIDALWALADAIDHVTPTRASDLLLIAKQLDDAGWQLTRKVIEPSAPVETKTIKPEAAFLPHDGAFPLWMIVDGEAREVMSGTGLHIAASCNLALCEAASAEAALDVHRSHTSGSDRFMFEGRAYHYQTDQIPF